jgi:hypothetical protein
MYALVAVGLRSDVIVADRCTVPVSATMQEMLVVSRVPSRAVTARITSAPAMPGVHEMSTGAPRWIADV